MKNLLVSGGLIKNWCVDIEESAFEQAKNLANLPFMFKHIALMPDCHAGYGMPIGGVLATKGVVVPNAVGVDIGCGMCAVKTDIKNIPKEILLEIVERTKQIIPVGHNHQKEEQDIKLMPDCKDGLHIVRREFDYARFQLGTLGGGNHFIEFQKDSDGYMWIMVHSGSRNLGKKVADHYNKEAVELNKLWHSNVDKSKELAFLPVNTEQGRMYLSEMQYCVDFAFANRKLIIGRIIDLLLSFYPYYTTGQLYNIAHNYAKFENHFGENVIVHRKGATYAATGTIGIIPGSQGTKSYIVEGLGNTESFLSCSHGAGRRMGRKEAQKSLNFEDEVRFMNEQGIIHGINSVKDLDESPGAYKDIDVVMQSQSDLVKILVELMPLAVIKG